MATIEDVRAAIVKMDPALSSADPSFETAVVLLSSLVVGPNIKRIAKFAKLPRKTVAWRSKYLRENEVWKGPKIYCDWMNEEDGGIAFWCDVNVAEGKMSRVDDDKYKMTTNGRKQIETKLKRV